MSQPCSINANPSTDSTDVVTGTLAQAASGYSRYVQRVRRRYASQMACLPEGPPVRALMEVTFQALQGGRDKARASAPTAH